MRLQGLNIHVTIYSDAHYRRRTCEVNPKLEVLKIVMNFFKNFKYRK
jgi:hypothetical protein